MTRLKFYAIVTYVVLSVLVVMLGVPVLFIYGLSILNNINVLYTVIAIGVVTACCLLFVVYSWFTNEIYRRDALKISPRHENHSEESYDWIHNPIYSDMSGNIYHFDKFE